MRQNRYPRRHHLVGEEATKRREARAATALVHYAEIPDERTKDARDEFGFIMRAAFGNPEAYRAALEAERQRRRDTAEFLERMAEAYDVPFTGYSESAYIYPLPVTPEPEPAPGVTYQAHVGEVDGLT